MQHGHIAFYRKSRALLRGCSGYLSVHVGIEQAVSVVFASGNPHHVDLRHPAGKAVHWARNGPNQGRLL